MRPKMTKTSEIYPRRMVQTYRKPTNATLPVEGMGKSLRGISILLTIVSPQRPGERLRNMTERSTWVFTITRHMQIVQILSLVYQTRMDVRSTLCPSSFVVPFLAVQGSASLLERFMLRWRPSIHFTSRLGKHGR